MNDLAVKVEAVMKEYAAGNAKTLLESTRWLEVRQEIKELVTALELTGKTISAARVDREYAQLAEALRQAVTQPSPPPIKDNFALNDASQEFLATLRALFRPDILREWLPAGEPGSPLLRGGKRKGRRQRRVVIYDVPNPDEQYSKKPWYYAGIRPLQIALALALENEPQCSATHQRLDTLLPTPPSKIFHDLNRSPKGKGIKWWREWITSNDGIYTLNTAVRTNAKHLRNKNRVTAKP